MKKKINQLDRKHNYLRNYESVSEAAAAVGVSRNTMSNAIRIGRLCAGYYWEKAGD